MLCCSYVVHFSTLFTYVICIFVPFDRLAICSFRVIESESKIRNHLFQVGSVWHTQKEKKTSTMNTTLKSHSGIDLARTLIHSENIEHALIQVFSFNVIYFVICSPLLDLFCVKCLSHWKYVNEMKWCTNHTRSKATNKTNVSPSGWTVPPKPFYCEQFLIAKWNHTTGNCWPIELSALWRNYENGQNMRLEYAHFREERKYTFADNNKQKTTLNC